MLSPSYIDACNVECVRTCGSSPACRCLHNSVRKRSPQAQDQGWPTGFKACVLSCAPVRAGQWLDRNWFYQQLIVACVQCAAAPFVGQLWCPHCLGLPTGCLLGRLKHILSRRTSQVIKLIWRVFPLLSLFIRSNHSLRMSVFHVFLGKFRVIASVLFLRLLSFLFLLFLRVFLLCVTY